MKRRLLFVLLVLVFGLLVGCSGSEPAQPAEPPPPPPPPLKAVADMAPTEGSEVRGTVTFEETDGNVLVTAELSGLAPGMHGFHIHEVGDCSAPDATSAGGHFNPMDAMHGGPGSAEHHSGDLGNIEADENGNASYNSTLGYLTLGEGPTSIVGRAVIVHEKEDDLESQPTGAAGARLACGVIVKQ